MIQPSDLLPPGPHRHAGHTLVFWRYLVQAGSLDAGAAGRGLRTIHDSLADYDGELPRAGRPEEVRAMLEPFGPSEGRGGLRDLHRPSGRPALGVLAAYGSYDEELLEQALPVYAGWVAASFMVAIARRPNAAAALERQLRFLRRLARA